MKWDLDPNRPVGFESRKSYRRRCETGFWDAFVPGPVVLDVGFRGGIADAVPILPGALGIELDGYTFCSDDDRSLLSNYAHVHKDWAYDGLRLPFPDGSVDCVHASHLLEHLVPRVSSGPETWLREWFRVLRVGGTMILMVPHAYLYERRLSVPPSRWSPEHMFSLTPGRLLLLVERSLEPNTYRVRHLSDDDTGYDYSLPIETHPQGCLEIICVIEKIQPPAWKVEP